MSVLFCHFRPLVRLCMAGVTFLVCVPLEGAPPAAEARKPLTFEGDVVPILNRHCVKCHGADKQEAGLDLRRRFTLLKGGDSGPAMVVGQPQQSLLVEFVAERLMPPDSEQPLSDREIQVLRQWIAAGAVTAAKEEQPLPAVRDKDTFAEIRRRHWAFQSVRHVTPPTVDDAGWVRTPIDAFIRAKLAERDWNPASRAAEEVLIRRLYFDLTGLPPAPEDIAEFVSNPSEGAYEQVVERLLDSPHYGERWAQHWLDVVRFAESEGFEYDRHLPDAWRFRDYVIDSLNKDKPFDQFLTEQIAGDELPSADLQAQTAAIFHRLGAVRRNAGNPDIALSRNEVLTERTDIIGAAFLGLTIGCARCHNHKLEPISQKDYYRLQAYLAATQEHNIPLATPAAQEVWKQQTEKISAQIKALKAQLAKASSAQESGLQNQIEELTAELPPPLPTIPGIRNDFPGRTPIHVLRRGVWEHKGIAVGPRPLSVLVSAQQPELEPDAVTPRTKLARWMADADHPLTARVIVNRLWQHHFGAGLVRTANDFGTHGDRPSHPDLLEWLARSMIDNGWRWKPIHRLIVLSNTYRQESQTSVPADTAAADPDNRLLSRFPRRRLSAEEIRDAMLTVSGRINFRSGGPSVMLPVDSELTGLLYTPAQWQVTSDPEEHHRRSVYLFAKRNLRLPFLETFDAPGLQTSCAVRQSSTHAPQALELLNGQFAGKMAQAFAERLTAECGGHHKQVVDRAYWLALGRSPTDREVQLSLQFLQHQPLSEFALAVFNLNDFIYVR